jgi:hypothetical protein
LEKIIDLLNNGETKIFVTKFYTEKIARELTNKLGITDYWANSNNKSVQ